MQSLLRLGLVDRLNLWLFPLVLGSGKQLYADGTVPTSLRLTESTPYLKGTLQLTYETVGTPTYGNLARGDQDLPRLAGDNERVRPAQRRCHNRSHRDPGTLRFNCSALDNRGGQPAPCTSSSSTGVSASTDR